MFTQAPMVVLEEVASQYLWIWHYFCGIPGSHNDLNNLDSSLLLKGLLDGVAPKYELTLIGISDIRDTTLQMGFTQAGLL